MSGTTISAHLGNTEPNQHNRVQNSCMGSKKRQTTPHCFQVAFCLKYTYNSITNKKFYLLCLKNEAIGRNHPKITQITNSKQQNQQIGNQGFIIKEIVYPFDPHSYISKRITIIAATTRSSPALIKKTKQIR